MVKVQIKYSDDSDKKRVLDSLSNSLNILKISKPYESGGYSRVYVDVQ